MNIQKIFICNERRCRKIYLSGIKTTHGLARELLDKPDEFLTVTVENREYSIDHIKPVKTYANIDDGVIHKTLVCEKQVDGNIIR